MKKILILIFLISSLSSLAQNNEYDTKLKLLKKVFSKFELHTYGDEKVFETKVWDTHATISFKYCYIVNLNDGIKAMAFNIYLSDDPKEYEYMVEEGIYNKIDIDETTSFQGGGERLIQVLFFNTKTGKFLGKAKDFPIDKLSWIPEGMGDVTEINEINSFKKSDASKNTCWLKITECPDCLGGMNYIFKYINGKILTSIPIDACIESVYEKDNKLIVKLIDNCYEVQYDNEKAQIHEDVLFRW